MSRTLLGISLVALTVAVAPACATKKFVRTEVGNVNTKVDTLNKSLEETQERTRQNETRIGTVDQKADQAGQAAARANTAATNAQQAADRAQQTAQTVRQEVTTRIDSVEAANKKLIYEVTLSEAAGGFKFGGTEPPAEAKAALDKMVTDLKADPKAVWIEIEGHTDNVGDKLTNERIGEERAEAVKKYLYQQHQIPLHKMNVISYGEDRPAAPNNSRDGRAQNRRVVVRVLS